MFKLLLPEEFRVSLKYSVIVNPAIAACFQYIFYIYLSSIRIRKSVSDAGRMAPIPPKPESQFEIELGISILTRGYVQGDRVDDVEVGRHPAMP